jgi:hypothetical protein
VELLNESARKVKEMVGLYSRLAAGDESALPEWRQKNTRVRAGTLEHA